MSIASFIHDHMEAILREWEAFAKTFGAVADNLSSDELRDHAQQILEFVCRDLDRGDDATSAGPGPHGAAAGEPHESASATHGKLRYASGFSLLQLIAEYRALRASVLTLWKEHAGRGTADDALDILRFNEAIDQSLAEAAVAYSAKMNETRDLFLAILGHDLRSPLAATAAAGTVLMHAATSAGRTKEIGERIRRCTATMAAIVNDLLALASIQLGGAVAIERQQCDLEQMCRWAIEDAAAAHPKARFALHASGELTGEFDLPRLQQIVTNLANNAAQYGTPGTAIDVEIAGAADHVALRVRNRGVPIPPDLLPKLFTSLVQVAGPAGGRRPRSSLGLGLFIARQIAVAHGGDIHATSDAAGGTLFEVTVPRVPHRAGPGAA